MYLVKSQNAIDQNFSKVSFFNKSDIVSNREVNNSNSEETVKKYVKDENTGAWVLNPKWQKDNSNQEESDQTSTPPAYLQNLLAEKRQVTKEKSKQFGIL